MQEHEDTIAAIATPMGLGGIGIVRMSGPKSREIVKKIFLPSRPCRDMVSHHLYLGQVKNPSSDQILDQVLLSIMEAPRSYTGEDVVEINSHSGYLLLSTILQVLLEQGARLAKPGEFTFRAFMNGRIDLTQAEAVIDLIGARSEKGLSMAASQVQGALRKEIEAVKRAAVVLLATLEAAIDFPEENETPYDIGGLADELSRKVTSPIFSLIESGIENRLSIDGVRTAIVGSSNAGKSSLFNKLLRQERAIVTPVPGTTRDVIESELIVEGIPLRLMDTAGIRKASDQVEKIGIEITCKTIDEADLILLVVDRSRPIKAEDSEIINLCRGKRLLLVLNKTDLAPGLDEEELAAALPGCLPIKISALTGEGIDNLKAAIARNLHASENDSIYARLAPNLRHIKTMTKAAEAFERAGELIRDKAPAEIAAFEVKTGIDCLFRITGEVLGEEVLDEIFSRFCIGK
ncbi:MAG: tRNA uridine-5-carboxymethylaminomethyl(34) synthesis GTPase MnmE [Desulfobacteraceae bacterium]|jgi:tRNA modification GTPase|nr:MAG: tRNA uridine-5-carboxymethylaminomethyl(34) synthesis GTPase MnmE [Desulfobacteraceae bacterium]